MARIKWKNPNDQLRGTFCGLVYKVRNGQQHVYSQPEPKLPKNATREHRYKYHRDCMVQDCVATIQRIEYERGKQTFERMQQIADKYPAIKKAVERMYDDFLPKIGLARVKMQKAIIYWYCYKKLAPELELFKDNLPPEYQQC